MVSSTDGYCTIIYFSDGELGEVYDKLPDSNAIEIDKIEKIVENEKFFSKPELDMDCNAVDMDITKNIVNGSDSIKDDKMDIKEIERKVEETEDFDLVLEDTVVPEVKESATESPKTDKPVIRTPRRVQLITISSPKRTKTD